MIIPVCVAAGRYIVYHRLNNIIMIMACCYVVSRDIDLYRIFPITRWTCDFPRRGGLAVSMVQVVKMLGLFRR